MLRKVPESLKNLDVERRVKIYRWILYAQLISTVLIAVGFILFILILAGVIHS